MINQSDTWRTKWMSYIEEVEKKQKARIGDRYCRENEYLGLANCHYDLCLSRYCRHCPHHLQSICEQIDLDW